jgi:hypothetical protein
MKPTGKALKLVPQALSSTDPNWESIAHHLKKLRLHYAYNLCRVRPSKCRMKTPSSWLKAKIEGKFKG